MEILIHHICEGKTSISEIQNKTLGSYIAEQLSYEEQSFLDHYCPSEIKLSGSTRKINYLGEQAPFVASAIQDFFGMDNGPAICDQKEPLTLMLLAPNRRPAQVTQNLFGFWKGSYSEVRKELARRYPKHHWPDDPTKDR